ncbi:MULTISPECIES: maltose operon protein MalM [Pasteurellaceae]|uniref:Maltose operon protein MalM n=1 Tax=Rodentibacter genomosp. 1 TaxID=1908264 RepID=A0A1V3J811_9PAST|nr:maltose operon protein MalM [Rodentibacter genomosp. 1]MBF0752393.1 maltose operon protein MalM [Pasteurella sp. 19428wF3_WM03]OOF51043.1 maltose operon protein MalM [Rodentibacter genomosp. 1]TFU50117.1 maltose operon protein MalM [Pasteurella sp. WM03]
MKKTLFSTALLLANMLVVLPSTATPNHINSTVLSQLNWKDVPYSETVTTTLSTQQKQNFIVPFAGMESPVATYRIPANQGTLEIQISSPMTKDHVFVPNAIVLDSQFNIAARYPSSEFKFKGERGLQPNRLVAELNLTPTPNQDYIYLLVYTTAQDVQKTTMVPHPAKSFAQATGKQPPSIADIEVKHSPYGEININVTAADGTRFIGIPTEIFTGKKSASNQSVGAKPIVKEEHPSKAVITSVDKETEAYFKQAVSNALKQNDVNRALNLVNEAEKLGLTSPRKIFLQQVSSK